MITINLTHAFLWFVGVTWITSLLPEQFKEEIGWIAWLFIAIFFTIICFIVFHYYTFNLIVT